MKNKKLILGLSTLLAVSGLAMSCGKRDSRTPEEKVEDVKNSLVYDGLDGCTTDITLIYEIPDVKGVEITYQASSDMNTIVESPYLKISEDKKKAEVTRPAKGEGDKDAFLHINIKCENVEAKKVLAVKIKEGGTTKSIADIVKTTAADKDNVVVTKGYVVAVGDGCCYIADNTGSILVYSKDAVKDIAVGDSVQAEGSLSFYQGVPQFASSNVAAAVTLTKLDETVDFTPTAAAEWDATKVDAYFGYTTADKLLGNHVSVTGVLTISGKYYNITVPGVTKGDGASVCYPNATMKEQLAALDGKAIKVTGYTLYISHNYMYLMAEKVEEAKISEDELFDAAVSALSVSETVYTSIDLPATGLNDVAISWASDNTSVIAIAEDGHTATVTPGAADVTVTLTATITKGTKSATRTFTVTVKAAVSFAHAGTEADPYSVADAIMRAKQAGTTATTDKYYIKGVVKSVNTGGLAQYGNINIDMIDEGKENDVFLAFQVLYQGKDFTAETAALITKGTTIVVCGPIVNYNDKTPETSGKGAASVMSIEAGEPVAATGVKANESLEVKVGKTASITATVEPSNATDKALTYTSKDEKVATVSDKGVVTGVAVGNTTITVSLTSNSALKAEVAINVVEAGQDPVGEEKVTVYDLTKISTGSELTTTTAKTLFDSVADENNALVAVTAVSKVFQGNGTGGAHANEGGLIKFGTKSDQGSITFDFGDAKLSKVIINCHDFYKVSSQFPTNSNTISVNNSEATLAPYNATGAGEDMEFTLDGASTLSIVANTRIVIFSITVYYN